jgi:molecular chaperone DnaJ
MERPKDYYRILGIPRDASPDAIRRAYRRLAKRLHPDVAAPISSIEDFREVQAAYETLSDAERRRRYDESLGGTVREAEGALAWSFLRSPARGDLRRPTQPSTLAGEIILSQDEAQNGGILPLDVPLSMTCPSCDGTGGFVFDCGRCGGDGRIERRLPLPLRIPPRVAEGTVFQVTLDDDPAVASVLLTIHIRRI